MDAPSIAEQKQSRRIWRWLLFILLSIVCAPFLVLIFFIALRIPAIVLTRPYFWETTKSVPLHFWETTKSVPLPEALAGQYLIAPKSQLWAPDAVIVLAVDHSASVHNVPAYDGFGDSKPCVWNGAGRWITAQAGELAIEITQPAPSSKQNCLNYGFDLLNKKPPHRLWLVVGDPDEGFGLIFDRQK